jgi:hypothetical protein
MGHEANFPGVLAFREALAGGSVASRSVGGKLIITVVADDAPQGRRLVSWLGNQTRAKDAPLSAEVMEGPFLKPYADAGHWFDTAHGKCIRCGEHAINLYEDMMYGPVRKCVEKPDE